MSRAERNWLLVAPLMRAEPPRSPFASMRSGGKPSRSRQLTCTPSCRSPSSRSPMGRSCMRGTPDSVKIPCPAASTAVSGRMAVPALPSESCMGPDGAPSGPPLPVIHMEPCGPGSPRTPTPRVRRAASITSVSSLSSTRVTSVSPSERALRRRTRFDRLFDPGSWSVPSKRAMGWRVRRSGSMATHPSAARR